MKYISTRGGDIPVSGAAAIIRGLASDRGLYVPAELPRLDAGAAFGAESGGAAGGIAADATERPVFGAGYRAVARAVLGAFLPDYSEEEIRVCVDGAYDEKFDTPEIAPLVKTDKAYFLELWHGGTAAFKDMALSILPYLLKTAMRKEGEDKKVVILTATSGDTGKAALAGFADVPGTEIFVFYPKDGVSAVQERQMVTQTGANVHVYGIRGNFDDAQKGVKNVFNDAVFGEALAGRGLRLSSANSINIGRLVPQVAYYVYAYGKLLSDGEIQNGEAVNICVPTGNFGNILAAYYAKQIGVPIARLLCASNENKVLTDFLDTGVYDARREFILTSSPSMDILISSNLERLLWHLSGGDSEQIAYLMAGLERDGHYETGAGIKAGLRDFQGGFADMKKAHQSLARLCREEHYLIDTHTAVGYSVYLDDLAKTGDRTKTIIVSTASPYKFAGSVAASLGLPGEADEFAYMERIRAYTGAPIPAGLRGLEKKPALHTGVIGKDAIQSTVDFALRD